MQLTNADLEKRNWGKIWDLIHCKTQEFDSTKKKYTNQKDK